MKVSRAKFRVASGLVLFGYALVWQLSGQTAAVKRVYVEPFSIKGGPGNLREDLVEQLRRARFIAIAPDRSTADAVLSGNGEVWIKGYQSLNPRSGRLPAGGTPVYTGFLSVELRDVAGDTLWSYLVTPGGGSASISKDLSKQVAKHLAQAVAPGDGSGTPRH